MQLLSRLALAVGLILLVAAAVLLGKDVIDINQLHAVANANRSTNFPSPLNNVLITAALAALGGLITGLGLGLSRTRRAPRTPH
ncbi:hypothetical protein CBQ26_12215 [Deinococcus indicus]|uniref:Uncharacterized protein n=1 Tax=Deinococcus indicus TaxID=223556 RepID=A0A246BJ96_9DEIO|nr:hypothetical protein [Deinococcus indicus]OWL95358.1 hypothetical protein CBQ26_12215 [Deinococcus indicus]GHG30948.1 hypothetical protein GCM10017784_25050 [Deinococcus indicus]